MRTMRIAAAIFLASAIVPARVPSESAWAADLTAGDLIAKVEAATGLNDVRTEIETYSTTIDGKYATVTMIMKRPDRYLERIRIPQYNVSNTLGVDGSTMWIQDTSGQVHVADAGDHDIGLDVISMLYSPQTWFKFVRKPDRDYLGVTCDVLRVTLKFGKSVDVLIDPKTFYPLAAQVTFRGVTISVEYREFTRSPGGELYPRHIAVVGPDGTTLKVYTITSLDANVPIDDATFAPPSS